MKLTSGAAINSFALAISSGLNFAAIFVWTRLLDPQAFGVYALVGASALLLNSLLFEWLRLVGARTLYSSEQATQVDPERAGALFLLYIWACLIFAGAALTLYLLDVGIDGVDARWWPVIVAFTLTEMGLAIINTVSRVRLKTWQFFRSMVARSVLSLAIGLVLVVGMGMEAAGAILGIVIAQGLVAICSVILDPLWRTIKPWRAKREAIASVLRFGYPLIASCALTYAAGVADRFLIGTQLGATEVGLYAAPVDLLQKTLVFVMMAINLTAYPVLVRTYEDHGAAAASKVLQRNFLGQLGIGLPAAVGLAVLAPGIANLLLGGPFREAGTMLLPFIGVAALLRCLVTFHLMMAFQVSGRMKLMLVPPIVMLAVLVPGGIVAMRSFGLMGMAAIAIAAQLVTYAVSAVLAKRVLDIRIVTRDSMKILLAGAVMGAVLFPMRYADGPIATVLLIAMGAAAYGVMLLLLRVEPVIAVILDNPIMRKFARPRSGGSVG